MIYLTEVEFYRPNNTLHIDKKQIKTNIMDYINIEVTCPIRQTTITSLIPHINIFPVISNVSSFMTMDIIDFPLLIDV